MTAVTVYRVLLADVESSAPTVLPHRPRAFFLLGLPCPPCFLFCFVGIPKYTTLILLRWECIGPASYPEFRWFGSFPLPCRKCSVSPTPFTSLWCQKTKTCFSKCSRASNMAQLVKMLAPSARRAHGDFWPSVGMKTCCRVTSMLCHRGLGWRCPTCMSRSRES